MKSPKVAVAGTLPDEPARATVRNRRAGRGNASVHEAVPATLPTASTEETRK